MPNLTAFEAAEKLETEATRREQLYQAAGFTDDDYGLIATLRAAASYLRAIAAGEYKQVVRGHWNGWTTSAYIGSQDEFGDPKYADRRFFRCSECRYGSVVQARFCPSCGALMDGKEDSHV